MKNLSHQKILKELQNPKLPDFEFLFSKESLNYSLETLEQLLEEEKKIFEEKLKTKNSQINFETFNDDSLLHILWSYLNHLKGTYDNTQIRKIIKTFEPKLIDFNNYISYNKKYYEMLEYYISNSKLDKERKKIIKDEIKNYKIRGINLDEEKQNKLKKINKKLSKLQEKFSNNELDSENEFLYNITSDKYLKELPEDILEQTKKKAETKKKKGYLFGANPSEYIAIMKYCSSTKIRKDFYKTRHSFASSGKFDNRKIVLETLKLKKQKAEILGYKNYAELSLEFKMAKTPGQIKTLLSEISDKAKKKAKKEILELEKHFKVSNLELWDLTYYFRKYKEAKYNINDKELKKYFEFEKVLSGLHKIVYKLYGLKLKAISPSHPNKEIIQEARFYEVYKDDKLISYYMLDPFYKPEKRGGAWADNIRNKFNGRIPIIVNVCNFQAPSIPDSKDKKSKIALLSLLEVETIFHEFGHAIHEISSKTTYPDLTGFGVERDFVEVPSQFMEHYTEEKEALDMFASHYETGEKISEFTLESLKKAEKIGIGNFVLRQNEFAFLDMVLHDSDTLKNIEDLDKKTLKIANKNSVINKDSDYKMYTSFSHIFAGGYSAGYYSYMWAEIIELDIWKEFKQKGIFDKKVTKRFFEKILSAGSSKKASKLFYDFMGREVSLEAFFEKKGI